MNKQTKKSNSSEKLGEAAVKSANADPVPDQQDAVTEVAPEVIASDPLKSKRKHYLWFFAGIVLVILIGFGLAFIKLAHQSLAHIYVGSAPVKADASPAQIQQQIKSASKNYKIRLSYQDGTQKSYSLAKAGIKVDAAASSARAKKVINASLWQRLQWWESIKIPLELKVSDVVFQSFISRYATKATKSLRNASLAIENGEVVIKPEADGRGYAVRNAEVMIKSSIANLSTKPLVLELSALKPLIKTDDLKPAQAKIEEILVQQVSLNIAGQTIVASRADIGKWLDLNPAPSAETVDVTVNSGRVVEYIDALAAPYSQEPRNRLVIKSDDTEKIIDYGSDGSGVLNKDKASASIAKHLLEGRGVSVDLPVSYAKAKTIRINDYDKWLIVDLTNKTMQAYEKSRLAKSFLVSAGAPLTPTVEGQFRIYAKVRSDDMRGANADGSRYFQPAVPYVNYFYGGYAIHGNYWRPASWFGNVNSSHGCVGITESDAAWVYKWAPIGTPIIIHS